MSTSATCNAIIFSQKKRNYISTLLCEARAKGSERIIGEISMNAVDVIRFDWEINVNRIVRGDIAVHFVVVSVVVVN